MSGTFTLKNENLTAVFSAEGAELLSLTASDGKEYIFRDTSVLQFSAPTLFPICGGLKDDKFIYDGKEYFLQKHGFAKESLFAAESVFENKITFLLKENGETLKSFPFNFELRITYTLDRNSLAVDYSVKNTTDGDMYYSIGAHEAYYCPGGIEKYSVIFDEKETLDSHLVLGCLLDYKTENILKDSDRLKLKYDLFSVDALVFSKFNSSGVTLVSDDETRKIRVDFPEFSHLLFWTEAGKTHPYICIEPWCGCPDMTDSKYDITNRRGIIKLAKGETGHTQHKITIIE